MFVPMNTFNELVEKALAQVAKTAGVDISDSSFTRALYLPMLMFEQEKINDLESELKLFSFTERQGEHLDDLYQLQFGISRLKGSAFNIRFIKFNIDSSAPGYFKQNGVIFIDEIAYKIIDKRAIDRVVTIEVKQAITVPNYTDLISLDNNIKIDIDAVELNLTDSIAKAVFISENFLVLTEDFVDTESDAEYKRRAHKIMQNYGFNNITKIQNQASSIKELADLKIEENRLSTDLIPIPTSFEHADDIHDQMHEIVNYYKGGEINLLKPSLMVFEVEGLRPQLTKWFASDSSRLEEIDVYLLEIEEDLENYVNKLYLYSDDKTFSPDEVEFIINSYFTKNNIIFSVNENELVIKFRAYQREKYELAITSGIIERRTKKNIYTDVCYFSDLN